MTDKEKIAELEEKLASAMDLLEQTQAMHERQMAELASEIEGAGLSILEDFNRLSLVV